MEMDWTLALIIAVACVGGYLMWKYREKLGGK